MENKIKQCSATVNKIHVDGENGRTIKILNPDNKLARHIRVDKCLLSSETKKCDCMYEVFEKNMLTKVLYVEFKGRDFNHGVDQLLSTIGKLKFRHAEAQTKKAILIGRGVPRIQTTVQRIKNEFYRDFKTLFCPKTNQYEEKI